jgi:hypothetical protein
MRLWIFAAAALGASLTLAQQTEKPPAAGPDVLFSGQPKPGEQTAAPDQAATMTDAERTAVVVTAWDLDLHLSPKQNALEAHARVTLRNDGAPPLERVALQLSSTLHFETVGFRGKTLAFRQQIVASDADHTGKLQEAVVPLEEPLASHAAVTLEIGYGGTIPLTAERLTAIGAPDAAAQASDWDRITEDFTGVRGFGNVVWYPVSSVPVSMTDGAKLFAEIGRQKLMDQDATVSLRVTEEFYSAPPNAVILDGQFVSSLQPSAMPSASFPGVITASVPATRLGFETPSFFLARRTQVDGHGLRVLATDTDAASAQRYVSAAGMVEPLVRLWLGSKPRATFTILDLPEPDDAPAETGGLLATPLSSDEPAHLAPVVVHALAHGAFWSPRAWLNEGVASFIGALWFEQSQGRTAAIENLNAGRPALALAEPATPGEGSGEDLPHAINAVYYRTKAEYVLWMLRDLAGDRAFAAALQAYDPAQDTAPDYWERLLEHTSGLDLKWFFDDWVYRDRGLPDFSIAGVYTSRGTGQHVVVAVDMINDGYAAAEVPLSVRGPDGAATDRVRIPAHGRITHRIVFQENPTQVDLNDGTVPEVRDSIHEKLLTPAPTVQ